MQQKNTQGGARPGAGRPKNKVKRQYYSLYMSEIEKDKVKIYLNTLKNTL